MAVIMIGTKFFYIRAMIITIIAVVCLFKWERSTVALCVLIYLITESIVMFIISKKRPK